MDTSTADRLVIRIHLTQQEPPPPPPRSRLSKPALLLSLVVVAVLLGWFGVRLFTSDAPAVRGAPDPQPAVSQTVASASEPRPPAPEVQPLADAPTSAVNEVIPDVPQSALDTVWGTVRVGIRVTIDKQGSVVETVTEDPGPSRYFARLSLDASKKWTFTPATSEQPRTMLLKFHFTRGGATAHAIHAQ
ncbi:energy transducer TonB [Steroidobacter gossypii]|uniref:hypothetical protein n=1 Tax=Steroidobacter gossypii TaxID=2805490 RepID=UPI001931E304|nr:hypothetical protein [Steroidobacter gossypii]